MIVNGKGDMSKKHYLAIFITIGLLFTIGTIFAVKQVAVIRLGRSQAIEICLDALSNAYGSDRPGYTAYPCGDTVIYSPIKYEPTRSFSLFQRRYLTDRIQSVHFSDGTNRMWCDMKWNGSKWELIGTASTMAGMCP